MPMTRSSKEALISESITFEHPHINTQYAMNHIDVICLDAIGGSPVVPTVGAFSIYVRTDTDGGFKLLADRGILDATKAGGSALADGVAHGASFFGFPLEFKIVPDSVDVAVAYRVDVKQGSNQLNSFPDGLIEKLFDPFIGRNKPFLNADFGAAMNQDATAGGTPIDIHDGEDSTLWAGTNIVGASVQFNSAIEANTGLQSVRANSPSTGDIWQFDNGSPVDLTGYSTLSMHVNVIRRWLAGDSVSVYAWDTLLGQIVGNKVFLEDYISQFDFNEWQQANIPIADMGLTDSSIYAIRFEQETNDGQTAEFYVDDLHFDETSTILFTVAPDEGKNLYVSSVRMTFVNNVTGAAAKEYNNMLGVLMVNGITINRTSRGIERVGRNISTSYDFYSVGFDEIIFKEGLSNSLLSVEISFSQPLLLESDFGDTISIGINDDLSDYIEFSAIARGKTDP